MLMEQMKADRNKLVLELTAAGAKFKGNSFVCPFHDDHHPSAGIFQSDNGWRYKCQTCQAHGDVFDVIAYNNKKSVRDVILEVNGKPKTPALSLGDMLASMPGTDKKVYTYADRMFVFRSMTPDGKTFRQGRSVDGGFAWGAPDKPWPLYKTETVAEADEIVVVEGEKCADSLIFLGFDATTSPGGASNAASADWSMLGDKKVILWPDNDDAGEQYMDDVLSCLGKLSVPPISVRVVDPNQFELAKKEDCADYIRRLWVKSKNKDKIRNEIYTVFDSLTPVFVSDGARELADELEQVISGEICTVATKWPKLDHITAALNPGTVTLLAGNPGASKSLMLLELVSFWQTENMPFAIYCLEETKVFHCRRILAQLAGCSGMAQNWWVKINPELAREIVAEYSSAIREISRRMWVCPDDQPTLPEMHKWAEQQCSKCRVVCIDPITSAGHTQKDIWNEDKMFIRKCEQSAKRHGASIILVTHPRQKISMPDLDNLSGSRAYGRFCQNALWLDFHEPKTSTVMMDTGRSPCEHNRTMHVLKSRNAIGTGMRMAFEFNPETLCVNEIGTIIKEKRKRNNDEY